MENENPTFGFDAQKEQYGDMISFGIVDPAKVTRIALEGASSISGLLITSECVITDKQCDDKCSCGCGGHGAGAGAMPNGMGGMDDFM